MLRVRLRTAIRLVSLSLAFVLVSCFVSGTFEGEVNNPYRIGGKVRMDDPGGAGAGVGSVVIQFAGVNVPPPVSTASNGSYSQAGFFPGVFDVTAVGNASVDVYVPDPDFGLTPFASATTVDLTDFLLVTVDNSAGNATAVDFLAVPATTSIQLVTPNGGSSPQQGDTIPIEWQTTEPLGTTIATVRLEMWDENLGQWRLIAAGVPNNSDSTPGAFNSYPWTITAAQATNRPSFVAVTAEAYPNVIRDQSDSSFIINRPINANLRVLDPVGSEPGGDIAVIEVNLSRPATSALSINLAIGGTALADTDYGALPNPVTVPAGAPSVTLVVTPIGDADTSAVPETVDVYLLDGTGYVPGAAAFASVTIVDDTSPWVQIIPTADSTDVTEGDPAGDTYDIVLTMAPASSDVIVDITTDGLTLVNDRTNISLTFRSTNFSVPQTVTVTSIDDSIAQGGFVSTIAHTVNPASDGAYIGLSIPDLPVNVTDDDTAAGLPGILVTPTSGLITSEDGATDTFTVVLNTQPTADVTIPVGSTNPAEAVTLVGTVTFTPANWNVPRTLLVVGLDDTAFDGDQPFTISLGLTLTTSDTSYAAIDPQDVRGLNLDNNIASVPPPVVTLTADAAAAPESGAPAATFTFARTTTLGTLDVIFSVAGAATRGVDYELSLGGTTTLSGTVVTFAGTTDTVAITLVTLDDTVQDPGEDVILTVVATGSYLAGSPLSAAVTILDDDTPGVTVTPATLNLTEGGGPGSYTVVLDAPPANDVVIAISPDPQVTLSTTSLTFDASFWNVPQTVIVGAVDDLIDEPAVHVANLTHTASSADANYGGIAIAGVQVNIVDNDVAPVISLGATQLTFTGTQDGPNPTDQTVDIANTAGANSVLNWTATVDQLWLTVTPTSGTTTTTPDTLTVTVDGTGLAAGAHAGTITIADPLATNNPRTVDVTFDVSGP